MKRTEIVQLISQHKAEINRLMTNKGLKTNVGFTLVNGKEPCFYLIETESGRVLSTLFTAQTAKDLLLQVNSFYKGVVNS